MLPVDVLIALIGMLGAIIAAYLTTRRSRFQIESEYVKGVAEAKRAEAEAEQARASAMREVEMMYRETLGAVTSRLGQMQDWITRLENDRESYVSRINQLEDRIAILQVQVVKLVDDLEEWKCGAKLLTDQVVGLGHKPAWVPKSSDVRRRK